MNILQSDCFSNIAKLSLIDLTSAVERERKIDCLFAPDDWTCSFLVVRGERQDRRAAMRDKKEKDHVMLQFAKSQFRREKPQTKKEKTRKGRRNVTTRVHEWSERCHMTTKKGFIRLAFFLSLSLSSLKACKFINVEILAWTTRGWNEAKRREKKMWMK